MKKILITGGLGLIGSSIAKKIMRDGYEVTIIDNKSTNITSKIESLVCAKPIFSPTQEPQSSGPLCERELIDFWHNLDIFLVFNFLE